MKRAILFTRKPVPGKVKTRLAKDIGDVEACRLYKGLLKNTLNILVKSNFRVLLFTEEGPIEDPEILSSIRIQKNQIGKDLGQRMKHAFALGFDENPGPLMIVGGDCPGLDKKLLETAYYQLESVDLVIGPANDGGYYLLGMRSFFPELFDDIPWSTSEVCGLTLKKAKTLNLKTVILKELIDLDTFEDLKIICPEYPLEKNIFSSKKELKS